VKLSVKDIIGILVGFGLMSLYISNARPIGWFDSIVGFTLFFLGFCFVKYFKGLRR